MTDVLLTGMDLKLERVARQVTATALAEKMGVSRSWLSMLEGRYSVKPEVSSRYLEALASFPSLASRSEPPAAA